MAAAATAASEVEAVEGVLCDDIKIDEVFYSAEKKKSSRCSTPLATIYSEKELACSNGLNDEQLG